MKIKYRFLLIILLSIGLLVPLTAYSQETQTEEQAISQPLTSPRACLRNFLKIMNKVEYEKAPRVDEAVISLYLDDIPEAGRLAAGRDIAVKLFKVLYHYTFNVDVLPDASAENMKNDYSIYLGNSKLEIALHKYKTGEWKIHYTKTLKRVDEYLAVVEKEEEGRKIDETVDPALRSPREAVRFFFSNMGKETFEGVEKAAEALDLAVFEKSARRSIGRERAMLLNTVLARTRYIDLVELSDESKSAPVVLLDDPAGRLVLERVSPPKIPSTGTDTEIQEEPKLDAWKFSAQSVNSLPALYDAYKEKEIVREIKSLSKLPLSIRFRDYMDKNFPALMRESFLLENWQWIGIFIIVFFGLFVGRSVIYMCSKAIKITFQKAKLELNEVSMKAFLDPIGITVTALIWWTGVYILGLPDSVRVVLMVSVKIVAALAAVWAGYKLVDIIGHFLIGKAEKTENKFDDILAPLVTRAMKVMVVIGGVVFLADVFAVDIDKIMAGLGLGGLAFALAAKDTISNVFGSVTILVDHPFQIGDWVTIGQADGVVESVGVRSTRIRTFYDSLITIPNSELINAQIDNYGARRYRRINTTLTIGLDTPPEKVDAFCEGIRELIRNHPCTRKDFFIINFDQLGPYGLGILVYCFVKVPDWVAEEREKHRLFNDILRLAKKLGIEFVPPTQHLYTRADKALEYTNIPTDEPSAVAEGKRIADDIMRQSGIIK